MVIARLDVGTLVPRIELCASVIHINMVNSRKQTRALIMVQPLFSGLHNVI